MTVKKIPDGYHTITPYLVLDNVEKCIDFLKKAFDAKEIQRSAAPDGTIKHAELKIGNSMLMLGGACGEYKPRPSSFYLYVEDTDEVYHRAIKAGGISILEPTNQFYGDRNAGVKDASDNQWWIATHIEDVSEEEMQKRLQTFYKKNTEKA